MLRVKPLKERASDSDLIIIGHITEVKKMKHPSEKMDHEAAVVVDKVLKGGAKVADGLKVYFLMDGWDSCRPGTQQFSEGKRKEKLKELFFLRKLGGRYLTSTEFMGGGVGFYDTKEYLKKLPDLLKKDKKDHLNDDLFNQERSRK
jgi:hypothetical protein